MSQKKVSEIRNEINRLLEKYGGYITPADLVKEARRKASPLHKCFTWDDKKAGERWRVHQARMMLCRFKILPAAGGDVKVRQIVSLPSDRRAGGGPYTSFTVIQSDEEKQRELVEMILNDLYRLQDRAAAIRKAFPKIYRAIEKAKTQIETERVRAPQGKGVEARAL